MGTSELTGYQAAISSAAFYLQPKAGYLKVEGTDRIAFLQRQTTNDLTRLALKGCLTSILTSPSARILDMFRVIDEGDSLGTITLAGHAESTLRYLKSRIFFMDKVSVVDLSVEFAQIDLEGPGATKWLTELGIGIAPKLDEIVSVDMDGLPLRILGQPGLSGQGYRLLVPAAAQPSLENTLNGLGIAHLEEEAYQALRVEAGLPAPGTELTEDYTPMEIGLDWVISDKKGCYTGQEVIARQITYDKITQQLVGLQLSSPAQPGERVWSDGKPAGKVTSSARSPRFGEIALAVLKKPFHLPNTEVFVGSAPDLSSSAIVSVLPINSK